MDKSPKRKPKTPESIALGLRVQQARKQAGITQEQLAKAADCSQQMIQALENGWHASSGLIVKIANRCKVSAWWLDTGEGSMLDRDIPISLPERALLIGFRAIPDEAGKNQVLANLQFWVTHPTPTGARGARMSRKTVPPTKAARRGTKGRGNDGGQKA